MTGFLTEILSVHPQSPVGDSPGGACASASLRRHLHCLGCPDGTCYSGNHTPDCPSRLSPQRLNSPASASK